jgi:hypothetical protein
VIKVTEALIGSALVVAQTHVKGTGRTSRAIEDICHIANYWKHRDEWCAPWASGARAPNANTLAAISRLGATPPVVLGQLTQLVDAVLGSPFDVEALWRAIA